MKFRLVHEVRVLGKDIYFTELQDDIPWRYVSDSLGMTEEEGREKFATITAQYKLPQITILEEIEV